MKSDWYTEWNELYMKIGEKDRQSRWNTEKKNKTSWRRVEWQKREAVAEQNNRAELKQSRTIEQAEEEKNDRKMRCRGDLLGGQRKRIITEQRKNGKKWFIRISCLCIHYLIFKGGWEVLGRTVVLRSSSGCLNTGSCSFHLVVARETRVAGWC